MGFGFRESVRKGGRKFQISSDSGRKSLKKCFLVCYVFCMLAVLGLAITMAALGSASENLEKVNVNRATQVV